MLFGATQTSHKKHRTGRELATETCNTCAAHPTGVECPTVTGYYFQQGRDAAGSDLLCTGLRSGMTAVDVARLCSANPSCKSFNIWGDQPNFMYCLKTTTGPTIAWPAGMPGACQGFYVFGPGRSSLACC